MTARETVDYILRGAKKSDLEFLAQMCHQHFIPCFGKKQKLQLHSDMTLR